MENNYFFKEKELMKIRWQKARLYQYLTVWVSELQMFSVFSLQGFHMNNEAISTSGASPRFSKKTYCFLFILCFLSLHFWSYNSRHLKSLLSSFLLSQILPFLKDTIQGISNFFLLCKPTLPTPTLSSLFTNSFEISFVFVFYIIQFL